MKNFTVSQLLKSLAMPAMTFLYAVIGLGGEIISGEVYFTGYKAVTSLYFPLAVMLLGGVLPTLMTLLGNIHTERYFIKLLIVNAIYVLLTNFVYGRLTTTVLSLAFLFAYFGVKIVYEILKVQDEETTGEERAVMLLSDPIIYIFIGQCMSTFSGLVKIPLI